MKLHWFPVCLLVTTVLANENSTSSEATKTSSTTQEEHSEYGDEKLKENNMNIFAFNQGGILSSFPILSKIAPRRKSSANYQNSASTIDNISSGLTPQMKQLLHENSKEASTLTPSNYGSNAYKQGGYSGSPDIQSAKINNFKGTMTGTASKGSIRNQFGGYGSNFGMYGNADKSQYGGSGLMGGNMNIGYGQAGFPQQAIYGGGNMNIGTGTQGSFGIGDGTTMNMGSNMNSGMNIGNGAGYGTMSNMQNQWNSGNSFDGMNGGGMNTVNGGQGGSFGGKDFSSTNGNGFGNNFANMGMNGNGFGSTNNYGSSVNDFNSNGMNMGTNGYSAGTDYTAMGQMNNMGNNFGMNSMGTQNSFSGAKPFNNFGSNNGDAGNGFMNGNTGTGMNMNSFPTSTASGGIHNIPLGGSMTNTGYGTVDNNGFNMNSNGNQNIPNGGFSSNFPTNNQMGDGNQFEMNNLGASVGNSPQFGQQGAMSGQQTNFGSSINQFNNQQSFGINQQNVNLQGQRMGTGSLTNFNSQSNYGTGNNNFNNNQQNFGQQTQSFTNLNMNAQGYGSSSMRQQTSMNQPQSGFGQQTQSFGNLNMNGQGYGSSSMGQSTSFGQQQGLGQQSFGVSGGDGVLNCLNGMCDPSVYGGMTYSGSNAFNNLGVDYSNQHPMGSSDYSFTENTNTGISGSPFTGISGSRFSSYGSATHGDNKSKKNVYTVIASVPSPSDTEATSKPTTSTYKHGSNVYTSTYSGFDSASEKFSGTEKIGDVYSDNYGHSESTNIFATQPKVITEDSSQ